MHVFSTLRCVNGAGKATSITSRAVLIVSSQCESSFTCLMQSGDGLPGRSVGGGFHPLFVPFAIAAAAARYQVSGDADMPQSGRTRVQLAVSLKRSGRQEDGSHLVLMQIEPGGTIQDRWGATHPMGAQMEEPIFFAQSMSGRITAVYHSPLEGEHVLWTKRVLASYMQLVRTPTRRHAWATTERDSGGPVSANYTHRRDLFGREVVLKQMRWHSASRMPKCLTLHSTVEAKFDRSSTWVRSLASELHITAACSDNVLTTDGREFLPTEPARLKWSRIRDRSENGARTLSSHSDTDSDGDESAGSDATTLLHGLIRAELEHVSAPEGVAKVRHRMGRLPALMAHESHTVGEQLECSDVAIHSRLELMVTCAATETETDKVNRQQRAKCISKLGELSAVCENLDVAASIEKVLLKTSCTGAKCTGLFGALEAVGNVAAQAVLARYIDVGGQVNGLDLSLALMSFTTPTETLVTALLMRLISEVEETGSEAVRPGTLLPATPPAPPIPLMHVFDMPPACYTMPATSSLDAAQYPSPLTRTHRPTVERRTDDSCSVRSASRLRRRLLPCDRLHCASLTGPFAGRDERSRTCLLRSRPRRRFNLG